MECPKCGAEVSENELVCPSCGEKIRNLKRRRGSQPGRIQKEIPDEKNERQDYGRREGRRIQGKSVQEALGVPIGLRSPESRGENVRYVRKAAEPRQRRLDAHPVQARPEIYRKTHSTLKHALLAVFFFTVAIISATSYVLLGTENGQRLMAQWGWSIAPTSAYVTLGKDLLDQGYYNKAYETLSVAVEREPENVDALMYMAQTQMSLGNTDDALSIYQSLVNDIAPEHPGAYRSLIQIYRDRGLNAEALELMKKASTRTGRQEFNIMLKEYTPETPVFSKQAGRYNETIDVTISIPDGETVYFTTDGTDPSEAGVIYEEGYKIHCDEGKLTLKAIGFNDNGVPSDQIEATYTVIIPTPAAPKSNYASGKYKKAPKVSLRPGDTDKKKNAEIVAIYYTLDGRQATTESTLYTGPIQLPTGDCELRAISVAKNGKVSYEMRVTYSVEGNLKKKYSTDDTFKGLTLFRTTYTSFVKTYGTPQSYEMLESIDDWYSEDMTSYEAVYSWGKARFAVKTKGADPVLYYLDTSNEKMTAPRSTKVGMKGSSVMDKFQDLGHPALDEDGNRLLYNLNSAGYMFGTYRKESDGTYAIHYYTPVDDAHTAYYELSYFLNKNGIVSHILWQRYISKTIEKQ